MVPVRGAVEMLRIASTVMVPFSLSVVTLSMGVSAGWPIWMFHSGIRTVCTEMTCGSLSMALKWSSVLSTVSEGCLSHPSCVTATETLSTVSSLGRTLILPERGSSEVFSSAVTVTVLPSVSA